MADVTSEVDRKCDVTGGRDPDVKRWTGNRDLMETRRWRCGNMTSEVAGFVMLEMDG